MKHSLLLDRYLFRTIIQTSLLVFFVFFALELFIFLMTELTNLRENYGLREVLIYVITTLPSKLYLSMPVILLLGSLMGLARLATTSELIIMLTAGLSRLQIIRVVMLAVGVLLIFSVILGEWIGPLGDRFGYAYKSQTFKSQSFESLNVWVKSGQDFLHIGELSHNKKEAYRVVRFHFDAQHALQSASYAEKAFLGKYAWRVEGVQSTIFQKAGGDLLHTAHQEIWPISVNLRMLDHHRGIVEQESLKDLYESIQYRKKHGFNVMQDEFLFWRRVWHPLATLLMISIATPFIFGSPRERSIGSKIIIGVLIALAFYTLNAFFAPIAAIFKVTPAIAAAMPSLCVALGVLGYILYRLYREK